jgi:hypothetical protein
MNGLKYVQCLRCMCSLVACLVARLVAVSGSCSERKVVCWCVGGCREINGCANSQTSAFMCDFLTKPPRSWLRSLDLHDDEQRLIPFQMSMWSSTRLRLVPQRAHIPHDSIGMTPLPCSKIRLASTTPNRPQKGSRVPCFCLGMQGRAGSMVRRSEHKREEQRWRGPSTARIATTLLL